MFGISIDSNGEIRLEGRFDAMQVEKATPVFDTVQETTFVNFADLDYISSAGLGVLLKTQKRLMTDGRQLILKNLNHHIREVFKYAGFDMIFKIE